jgi:SAM-dependent methyltransferase
MPNVEHDRRSVEDRTRAWLEASFRRAREQVRLRDDGANVFDAAGTPRNMSAYHFQEILRKVKIFRQLERVAFGSFIDVGSGIDVYPARVAERYGVPAFYADLVHDWNLPYWGSGFGRLDRAVTMNLASLPFRDGAFDVVLSSEVLEHLVRPVEAIAELVRVAGKAVVMTSLEALAPSRWARWRSHWRVDVRVPHVERNFFLLEEIEAIFGPDVVHENLLFDPDLPASGFAPRAQQDAAYAALADRSSLEAALCRAAATRHHGPGAMGILLAKRLGGRLASARPPAPDAELVRWLIDGTARFQCDALRLLRETPDPATALPARERPIAPELIERLRCPDCRTGGLVGEGTGLRCLRCGEGFAGEYGVPILYPHREREPDATLEEALDRLCGTDAERRRIVRRLALRLRRNERPPGLVRRATWRLGRHP